MDLENGLKLDVNYRYKPINIEILKGHQIGISDSYYRAIEAKLLEDYLKAFDFLTI